MGIFFILGLFFVTFEAAYLFAAKPKKCTQMLKNIPQDPPTEEWMNLVGMNVITEVEILGSGGEGRVYRIRDDKEIRTYKRFTNLILYNGSVENAVKHNLWARETFASSSFTFAEMKLLADKQISKKHQVVEMENVFGRSVKDLLEDSSLDKEFKSNLEQRYQSLVRETVQTLIDRKLIDVVIDSNKTDENGHSIESNPLSFLEENSLGGEFYLKLFDRSNSFGIDPSDVIVRETDGRLIYVDLF